MHDIFIKIVDQDVSFATIDVLSKSKFRIISEVFFSQSFTMKFNYAEFRNKLVSLS